LHPVIARPRDTTGLRAAVADAPAARGAGWVGVSLTTALARRTGWVPGGLHRSGDPQRDRGGEPDRPVGPPLAFLLCPVLLLLASAGSAMADRYMPRNEKGGTGYYAWVSQNTRLPSGQCPLHTRYTTPSCEIPAPAAPGAVAPAPAVTPTPAPTPTPAILTPSGGATSPTPATG
jgi:hypothetical protein